jgi:hypothetical protein
MDAIRHNNDTNSLEWITLNYGAFIDTNRLALLLGYRNAKAVRTAHSLGKLGFKLQQIEGRRGLYATAQDASSYLRSKEMT